MLGVRIRKYFSITITVLFLGALWWAILRPPALLVEMSDAGRALLFASVITLVATLGGLLSVIYFFTAQTRPLGLKSSGLIALYRDPTFAILIGVTSLTLVVSILGLVSSLPDVVQWRLAAEAILGALYISLGLTPVAATQFENMNVSVIAGKLLGELTPSAVREYGLVEVVRDGTGAVYVELKTNGLNYSRRDPLRPFHELVQQAIASGDRLMLGKLLGALMERVCVILGVRWPHEDVDVTEWKPRVVWFRKRSVSDGQLAVVVHVLHYVLRLTRNQVDAGLDVGRHSAQYQLAKLLTALAPRGGVFVGRMLIVTALVRISSLYANIRPYGRVEPLNALAASVSELESWKRAPEVAHVLAAIATIRVQTSQLDGERGAPLLRMLSIEMQSRLSALEREAAGSDWIPVAPIFDPWEQSFPPLTRPVDLVRRPESSADEK